MAPIRYGALLIGDDGRIAEVGPAAQVRAPEGVPEEGFPDSIILPGLVNTHTHLELTGFDSAVSDADFTGWIRQVITLKAARSPDEMLDAARQGIRDCWAAGVTTVADTGDTGAAIHAMRELGASGIAYQEIFGPNPGIAAERLSEFRERFDALRQAPTDRVVIGVSPHAPYSVSGPLYKAVADWAWEEGLPLAVHIAESEEEEQLVQGGSGPFAEQWKARGIPRLVSGGATPIEWLERHGVLGERTLCIHAVRANELDIIRLARSRSAVAHCPRSNLRHAGRPAPLAEFLSAGIRVGVGTDSVASVSPLDLLAEAREARRIAGLSASGALDLVTRGAAAAIGLEREVGTLASGSWGDAVVITPKHGLAGPDPFEMTLASRVPDVALTLVGGREVYRRPPS
ncbi:MAG TPA: amidohydrolase family protein [Gemmatimonadales bacterium]|nr:amidohydrolase family protein [Gemmatimonadales bacterium]